MQEMSISESEILPRVDDSRSVSGSNCSLLNGLKSNNVSTYAQKVE